MSDNGKGSAKQKPKMISMPSKAREQFGQMQAQVTTFMQGVRAALNVPDGWMFDARLMAYVEPEQEPKPEQEKKPEAKSKRKQGKEKVSSAL